MLLTAGERISMALLAMAIHDLGVEAPVLHRLAGRAHHRLGARRGPDHRRDPGPHPARDRRWGDPDRRRLPGRRPRTRKDITTLGRGGSDTTAVALAAALDADVCEIYTDVDGVFTADPRVVPGGPPGPAHHATRRCSSWPPAGAKVLHLRCVEYARRCDVPIHVRSSFSDKEGTWVLTRPIRCLQRPSAEGTTVEQPIIAGVAARPQRRQDHRGRRARQARARPRGSSRPSPTPASTST